MSTSVRIIAGAWRRLQVSIPPVEGVRPSPDRVRETLFNWLGQDCEGWRVLDLFAGTGVLGFEAASRGAHTVQFVEHHREVVRSLQKNSDYLLARWDKEATGEPPTLLATQTDVQAFLAREFPPQHRFDLAFVDPPFYTDGLDRVLPQLPRLLKPGSLVYIEWHENLFDPQVKRKEPPTAQALALRMKLPELHALRYLKAGQVHAHLVGIPAV